MARIQNKAARTIAPRNSMIETLEGRQMFCGGATAATLGDVNISLTAITPSVVVDYTRLGVDQSWGAGKFIWSRSATSGGSYNNKAMATSMTTFCIEPDQDVTTPVVNYTVTSLAGTSHCSTGGPLSGYKADEIRELWGRYYNSIGTDNTKAAAFQMAIWEIVCDNDLNLSTGTFSVDSTTASDVAVKGQAQTWLNNLTGCGPKADLLALTSPTDQDQVFQVDCTPPTVCFHYSCDWHPTYHCFLSSGGDCLGKQSSCGNHGC